MSPLTQQSPLRNSVAWAGIWVQKNNLVKLLGGTSAQRASRFLLCGAGRVEGIETLLLWSMRKGAAMLWSMRSGADMSVAPA